MRGDRPGEGRSLSLYSGFTPHARGSTTTFRGPTSAEPVYPACAGIDLERRETQNRKISLPRMRGDRPYARRRYNVHYRFTPHARGSTRLWKDEFSWRRVYPACAGIDLWIILVSPVVTGLPRMRGDRPCAFPGGERFFWFTPHARGSTRWGKGACCLATVYPACAGIDPCISKKVS